MVEVCPSAKADQSSSNLSTPKSSLTEFSPPSWLSGPHRQTIAGSLLRRAPRLNWKRQYLMSAHGDSLSVDILPSSTGPARKRLLILHGLTGNSHSSPVPQIARQASTQGVESWALNFRGADGFAPEIPRLYHAGCSDDLEAVVACLPDDLPWCFVGFSLGGNVLLKWLGESPERQLPGLKAMTVSCPFDLAQCARNLESDPINRVYRWVLMRKLKSLAHRFALRHPQVADLDAIAKMRTFHDIDNDLIAPLHGFQSAQDYWHRCSSARVLLKIRTPTLIVHALDDPFLPDVPQVRNSHLDWLLTSTGGHLGFIDGRRKDWLVHCVTRYAAT